MNEVDIKIKEIQDKGHAEWLGNLYDRWQDEFEYEDWEDYKTAILKRFEEERVHKIQKFPFQVGLLIPGYVVYIRITQKETIYLLAPLTKKK